LDVECLLTNPGGISYHTRPLSFNFA
jgi:hypothetical protein